MQHTDLSTTQKTYSLAVDEWVDTIREEESLACRGLATVEQIDEWENAHLLEEEARKKALQAKKEYEDALRAELFHF